ncbi:hypothetical protein RRG08_005364, partial [Elysia crispata]
LSTDPDSSHFASFLTGLCICGIVGGVTLPGNSDVHITGPDIAPDGNSFALSCSCLDFMKSVYQMNPNFPDNITVQFFAEAKMISTSNFNPGGLTCAPKLVFGIGGPQDDAINSNVRNYKRSRSFGGLLGRHV